MTIWLTFLIGLLFGLSLGSICVVYLVRRIVRKSEFLQKFISELYHQDLLPEVCRIQGLLNLALMESKMGTAHAIMYVELALKEVLAHKNKITQTIKKYESD